MSFSKNRLKPRQRRQALIEARPAPKHKPCGPWRTQSNGYVFPAVVSDPEPDMPATLVNIFWNMSQEAMVPAM